jgi:hypothetical protein
LCLSDEMGESSASERSERSMVSDMLIESLMNLFAVELDLLRVS